MQGGPKKRGYRFMTITLSILNRLIFFTEDSWVTLQLNGFIPPHLAHVATQYCEALMSAKQAINDKLQGNVATYLRCGRVFSN